MNKINLILLAILISATSISYADVVSIADSTDIPNSEQGILRPVKGLSMAYVEKKFGIAEHISDAIGKPPITIWTYPEFIVYFEYNHVIHSVVPH